MSLCLDDLRSVNTNNSRDLRHGEPTHYLPRTPIKISLYADILVMKCALTMGLDATNEAPTDKIVRMMPAFISTEIC